MVFSVQTSLFQNVLALIVAAPFFAQAELEGQTYGIFYGNNTENTRRGGSSTTVVPYPVQRTFRCAAECSRDESCDAFAFNQCEKKCHKYCFDRHRSETLVTANGWTYYEKDCMSPLVVSGKDCADIYRGCVRQNGVYNITLSGFKMEVYCDMVTDGGGWTVFQSRQNGAVDFYRDWADYKNGFGKLSTEFWLGLDNIHQLTQQTTYELRVDMEEQSGNEKHASYSTFSIAPESQKYTLTLGVFSGDTTDSLSWHNGRNFTTKDRDNDSNSPDNCAVAWKGAWWYTGEGGGCHSSNLNGQYGLHMVWPSWPPILQKKSSMKLRPVGFRTC